MPVVLLCTSVSISLSTVNVLLFVANSLCTCKIHKRHLLITQHNFHGNKQWRKMQFSSFKTTRKIKAGYKKRPMSLCAQLKLVQFHVLNVLVLYHLGEIKYCCTILHMDFLFVVQLECISCQANLQHI